MPFGLIAASLVFAFEAAIAPWLAWSHGLHRIVSVMLVLVAGVLVAYQAAARSAKGSRAAALPLNALIALGAALFTERKFADELAGEVTTSDVERESFLNFAAMRTGNLVVSPRFRHLAARVEALLEAHGLGRGRGGRTAHRIRDQIVGLLH